MGEIAEMILDGILDEQTGEYIGEAVGYPRTIYRRPRRHKRNVRHAMKGESLGGLHLVGKKATIENIGECDIVDYVGKRGRKRYILIDKNGTEHRRKFSSFKLFLDL